MPLPDHVKVRRECLSFVVLGATGNLAQKKLLPSLFNLFANGHLPARTLIVCGGRPAHTAEQFNEITSKSLREFLENASAGRATHEKDTTDVKPFRHPSLAAGFDDLDLDFRASLGDEPSAAKKTILLSQKQKHSPPPLPPPTTRDIGGCAVTSRKSSFVNLVDLDQQGNTDDDASSSRAGANQSPQKTQSKLKPRFGNAAGVAKSQSAPEFLIADFLERVRYACVPTFGNVDDANDNLRDVFGLVTEHELKNADAPGKNRLYYLAMPHELYLPAADAIHRNGRAGGPTTPQSPNDSNGSIHSNSSGGNPSNAWTRIVVEKPFGSDLQSARAMHVSLAKFWSERDLYRIDRYLGKEVIDNLLVMRFANRMLTPIWNRENVSTVQIVFKEIAGTTAEYFDKHGIVRDVMQNHLLQIMAVLAMDRPVSLASEDIRDAKLKVLRQVAKVNPATDVVAGQYVSCEKRNNGCKKPGYKDNASVPRDSTTPTYACVVLNIRNERWDGVPFILKAGKALDEVRSEIRVQLKSTPGDIFSPDDGHSQGRFGADARDIGAGPNEFVIRIQPREEMYMKLTIKEPGLGVKPVPSEMELSGRWRAEQERKEIAGESPRRAYERLILDAVNGHQQHFVRGDELEAAWAIVDPINAAIRDGTVPIHEYPRGSRGPKAADVLRKSVGHVTCAVPRDGKPLSSSDDLCEDDDAEPSSRKDGLAPIVVDGAFNSSDTSEDGTPKLERRYSGVPASMVWGRDGEESGTPAPPETQGE